MRTGFDQRGPDGTGAVRLVTRFLVQGRIGPFPGFATLDVVLAPEPRGLAAVSAGVALLVAAGVARRRA